MGKLSAHRTIPSEEVKQTEQEKDFLWKDKADMKRPFERLAAIFIVVIVGLVVVSYGISFVWPVYEWDMHVPSPDGRYDLVILRGNAAAFDDYSYQIYLFPHDLMPKDRPAGTRVWLTSIWRGKKYLVYSGYNYPMFRWTGTRSLEIDLSDLYPQPFFFEPVKVFGKVEDAVLFSLLFGKEDTANTRP